MQAGFKKPSSALIRPEFKLTANAAPCIIPLIKPINPVITAIVTLILSIDCILRFISFLYVFIVFPFNRDIFSIKAAVDGVNQNDINNLLYCNVQIHMVESGL